MAMHNLCEYYARAEPQSIMTLGTRQFGQTKCAATTEREPGVLQAHPESPLLFAPRLVAPEHPSEGTSGWFLVRWNRLLQPDQDKFRSYVSGLLRLADPLDFCVDVDERPGATVPVVFYIDSALTALANTYFRADATPLRRALQLLHQPDTEYRAFWDDATGRHPEHFQDASHLDAPLAAMRACLN